jgi:pyruvate formate lyase activating enzyme
MKIYGIQGTSVIDYPGRIATILFLGGCNFRCPFCQNVSLVKNEVSKQERDIKSTLSYLEHRKNFITGVVVTGGEPLVHGKDLVQLLRMLKEMDLSVKLDTNGYQDNLLQEILETCLVDYIAMDIKTSLDKYAIAVGKTIDTDRLLKSLQLIRNSGIAYEFRTTCVPGLVDKKEIRSITALIEGASHYYLQQYRVDQPTLDPAYSKLTPYGVDYLELLRQIAMEYLDSVSIRGI